MISSMALMLGCQKFQQFYEIKLKPLSLKSWHFEASEDIMTKFKSQGLHTVRIKYCNAGRSGNPPALIPILWNIGILLHKQATRTFCWPVYNLILEDLGIFLVFSWYFPGIYCS